MKSKLLLLIGVGCFGIASAFETRASIFAGLLLVIGFASLTRFEHPKKKALIAFFILSSVATVVGMMRFVFTEGFQGIAEASGRASSKKAVSTLREILFAQDALRRYAMIDPDQDGIGSAARLGELAGTNPARGEKHLETPPLSPRFAPKIATKGGPSTELEGFLYTICLPGKNGGWVNHPAEEVDEERAEREWIAYAWPADEKLGHESAYFIDAQERILESSNLRSKPESKERKLRLVGPARAPQCTDALDSATEKHWQAWRNKKPRKELPGDKTQDR